MSRYLTLSGPSGISGADLKRRIGAIMGGQSLRRLGPTKKAFLGACGIAVLAAPLALGLAASPLAVLAQAPVSVQGAVGTALAAPVQVKVTAPLPAPTVKPGAGGANLGAPARRSLAEALAAGDIVSALNLGASAADIVEILRAQDPDTPVLKYPADPHLVTLPDGRVALQRMCVRAGSTESVLCSTSIVAVANPDGTFAPLPAPPPPSPAMVDLGQRVLAGASPQQTAQAIIAAMPPTSSATPYDPATARYFRLPNGAGLGVLVFSSDTQQATFSAISGTASFPGLADLPTQFEVVQATVR